MRTNYNDSSNRNNGRFSKRQNNGGRRSSGSGRRGSGPHTNNGSINVSSITSTRNKYLEMAKESLSNGNRVEAENYYQHAEHYSKMLNAAMATKRERDEANDVNQRGNGNNSVGNGSQANYSEKGLQDRAVGNQPVVSPQGEESLQ